MDGKRASGAVVLCVGRHGVAASTLRVAATRARRASGVLVLLHVVEGGDPTDLGPATTFLDAVVAEAEALLGARVRLQPLLAVGGVLEGVSSEADGAALVVLERPALVRLGGLVRRTSLTTALVEHLDVPILVVPGLWPAARAVRDDLPASWHGRRSGTVAVVLDDPAECRQVVNAGLQGAADIGGVVELVRGWEADRAAVVAASRDAELVVVGRGGSLGGLSVTGRTALHESVCPVLVVDVPAPVEALAEVLPFRRRA